jgi:hypothetical protein
MQGKKLMVAQSPPMTNIYSDNNEKKTSS